MNRPGVLKRLFVAGCFVVAVAQSARPGEAAAEPRGWIWANPTPQGNDLFAVARIDDQIAYAAGAAGTLVRLTKGGREATFLDTPVVYQTFHDVHQSR